jgi:hypothetical protein
MDAIILGFIGNIEMNRKIEAFVDDAALIMTILTHNLYLIILLEQNAQTWERLLHASGGKL